MSVEFRVLEPEVAGGLGSDTVLDHATTPPTVLQLHYEFEGWLGDELLTTFPCFIVTKELMDSLREFNGTGYSFDNVRTSISRFFKSSRPDIQIPEFVWLKLHGIPGKDDMALGPRGSLVVSPQCLEVLQRHAISNCIVRRRPFHN